MRAAARTTPAKRPVTRAAARPRPAPRAGAPARAPRLWRTVVAFAALLLAGALFHVWSRLHVVDLGYRLAGARAAHAHLVEQNRRLSLELATLEAPARVAEQARRRLGLAAPSPAQIIHLGPVAGTPAPRSGAAPEGAAEAGAPPVVGPGRSPAEAAKPPERRARHREWVRAKPGGAEAGLAPAGAEAGVPAVDGAEAGREPLESGR